MRNIRSGIVILIFLSLISLQVYNVSNNLRDDQGLNSPLPSLSTKQADILKIDIQVTAPNGYSMQGNTPIILKLSTIAAQLPGGYDAFGDTTPADSTDNIKWTGSYVTYENDIIPSQVDDIDSTIGYSADDEFLFQLPSDVSLASGESTDFALYIGTEELNLPEPIFPETCPIYDYPELKEVQQRFPDMLGTVYNLDNGKIRVSALVDAAWSSGGMYHLALTDELGENTWDAIKQGFLEDWEAWKWARFATVEQFIELNDAAGSNPFYLPDPSRTSLISGPVRCRIQMRSTPPYGKAASSWGTIPNLYGLVTYNLFANLPYVDYILDTTGSAKDEHPTLIIELQNREFNPGGYGSPYKGLYFPGYGWQDRSPDDLDTHIATSSDFTDPWYIEKLPPGEIMNPDWADSDKLGVGIIFNDAGLSNITWKRGSESVNLVYDAAEIPLHARYLPYDVTVTDDAISYMEAAYEEWLRPDPDFSFSVSTVNELPFEAIFVSRPDVYYDNNTNLIQIENITAISTQLGVINNTISSTHTYEVVTARQKTSTGLTGDLIWNSTTSSWEATNVDVSSLDLEIAYTVFATFQIGEIIGKSPYSKSFPEIPDIYAPTITSVIQSPMATAIIRHTDEVNVSALVTDDDSGVEKVILSYNNGEWFNITMSLISGLYVGTIPPQDEGLTIWYKIIAYDYEGNWNDTDLFSYTIAIEYRPGQGLLPLLGISAIIIIAVVVALRTMGMHRIKYDQVE